MGEGAALVTIEAVPSAIGGGWRILIQWTNGRRQYISGFDSLGEAEFWIQTKAQSWLRALEIQL